MAPREENRLRDRRKQHQVWFGLEVGLEYFPHAGAYVTATYIALLTFANREDTAWPSWKKLAQRAGISERQARRAVAALVEAGLVTVTPRYDDKGSQTSNLYELTDPTPEHRSRWGGGLTDHPPLVSQARGGGLENTPPRYPVRPPNEIPMELVPNELDFEKGDSANAEPDDVRERLEKIVRDIAVQLGDEAPLAATVTRVEKLYRRAGLPLGLFAERVYRARTITQERSAGIQKGRANGAGPGGLQKNKMPYFLRVLEQLTIDDAPGVHAGARKD